MAAVRGTSSDVPVLNSRFSNLCIAATHSLGNERGSLFELRSKTMNKTDPPAPRELKTVGLTPFIYRSDQPLF